MYGLQQIVRMNEVAVDRARREAAEKLARELASASPLTVKVGEQLTMEGEPLPVRRSTLTADRVAALRELADTDRQACSICGEDFFQHARGTGWTATEYYSDPWQEEADRLSFYCSEECEQADDGSFSPEYCDSCERDICQRCESNGWREYFRVNQEEGGLECVKCYQERLMEYGIDADAFLENERIPGDFFDDADLQEAGFRQVGQDSYQIPGGVSDLKEDVRRLLHRRLVINLERVAIGGGEGYVTLWAARKSA